MTDENDTLIRWLDQLSSNDTHLVGGKNASLGEMIRELQQQGVKVPGGFATTAAAYRSFLEENELRERMSEQLEQLRQQKSSLKEVGRAVRRMIRKGTFPKGTEQAIRQAYRQFCEQHQGQTVAVAVRSSATAENLPEASFAGQQETYLNITGEDDVLDRIRDCFASLFTDRAIAYREEHGFDHMKIALSAGVQLMVHSDRAGSGVMFSLDTETGFRDVVVINAAWGLGETVVQGTVIPDEYRVFKPLLAHDKLVPIVAKTLGAKQEKMIYSQSGDDTTRTVETTPEERRNYVLSDDEILQLARWAVTIEQHYEKPMDMEWAKDGETGELFIVQARPETVQSQQQASALQTYRMKEEGPELVRGLAIGQGIGAGAARILTDVADGDNFQEGEILVTTMTDPDWVPLMKRAAAIVTDHGGRTSHAAIVSRELGLPAIVGAGNATAAVDEGQEVTVSCAEGEQGIVYQGKLDYEQREVDLTDLPQSPVTLMMNSASPSAAFRWWRLPVQGVGLARMEFIINNAIKIHPLALIHPDRVEDEEDRRQIEHLTRGYDDKTEYFVETLARGIATIAAAQHPHPVIVRLSDFKTNEYADLVGGRGFEPAEENPMLGFRGASRYHSERYQEGFALECRALRRARQEIGLKNIKVMIPFVRTPEEADACLEIMAQHGLARGEDDLEVYMMCEIPANVFLAEEFAKRFDGFSIGSNDLTQLVLGVDRDSTILKGLFDERNEAVKTAIAQVIRRAHEAGIKVGICGQAPSDYPEFAEFLVQEGIDSISLNPDSVIPVLERLAGK